MSDINAAPSSTKADEIAAETTGISSGGNAAENAAISSASGEVGASTVGESSAGSQNADTGLTPSSNTGDAGSATNASPTSIASSSPTLAASGTGTTSTADTTSAEADDPNAVALPDFVPSAFHTASSAQGASQGGDTEAAALHAEIDATHAKLVEVQLQLAGAHEAITALQQQVTDEQARVIKWQGMYNAATAAKPHAQSLLQKLESGEAIVLGDLTTKLRALIGAL